MNRGSKTVALLILALPLLLPAAMGQEPSHESALDAIREDLVELRFEKALSTIEAHLAKPTLSEQERFETLILRAQAHVAYGDLDAAEKDYRDLLSLRPAYVPEDSLTPPKAMARFTKLRDAMVGSVILTLKPEDAVVTVDGRRVRVASDGVLRLLAGKRRLRAERPGFDTSEVPVEVPAGERVPVLLELIPNSRTVILRTDPGGVTITMDGKEVGETIRRGDLGELTLQNLSLGEHTFRFSKPCFRSAVFQDILTVDLTTFHPKEYDPVVLEPARSGLTLEGGIEGARVRIDGEPAGSLPLSTTELCPGRRKVEVRSGGRMIWQSEEDLAPDQRRTLTIRPRPNAALVGTGEWPAGLEALASRVSTVARVPLPGDADLSRAASWDLLRLPEEVDLALAVVPPDGEGSTERWWLFSPLLRVAHRVDGVPLEPEAPSWSHTVLGMALVDSRIGGPALVAAVEEGGPASAAGIAPGDRLLAIGDTALEGAASARRIIDASAPGTEIRIQVRPASGEERWLEIRGRSSPRILPPEERDGPEAILLASWASVEGAVSTSLEGATALANLALALSDAGRHDMALETWRRVRWGPRRGVGDGTAAYYMARELEKLSREKEAREAYGKASRSSARTMSDQGPRVAPAADDHLVDLGVSPEGY